MEASKLQVFVDATIDYFNKFSGSNAKVGAPFLISSMNDYFEKYSSFISISGRDTGAIFFTSAQPILVQLLTSLRVTDISSENLLDLVGEIANTISGNARKVLGHEFIISTPVILNGQQEEVRVAKAMQIYVVPIHWRDCQANLIISLD